MGFRLVEFLEPWMVAFLECNISFFLLHSSSMVCLNGLRSTRSPRCSQIPKARNRYSLSTEAIQHSKPTGRQVFRLPPFLEGQREKRDREKQG